MMIVIKFTFSLLNKEKVNNNEEDRENKKMHKNSV